MFKDTKASSQLLRVKSESTSNTILDTHESNQPLNKLNFANNQVILTDKQVQTILLAQAMHTKIEVRVRGDRAVELE